MSRNNAANLENLLDDLTRRYTKRQEKREKQNKRETPYFGTVGHSRSLKRLRNKSRKSARAHKATKLSHGYHPYEGVKRNHPAVTAWDNPMPYVRTLDAGYGYGISGDMEPQDFVSRKIEPDISEPEYPEFRGEIKGTKNIPTSRLEIL